MRNQSRDWSHAQSLFYLLVESLVSLGYSQRCSMQFENFRLRLADKRMRNPWVLFMPCAASTSNILARLGNRNTSCFQWCVAQNFPKGNERIFSIIYCICTYCTCLYIAINFDNLPAHVIKFADRAGSKMSSHHQPCSLLNAHAARFSRVSFGRAHRY